MNNAETEDTELPPINLVDCGLEELVAALLARPPIATSAKYRNGVRPALMH
jgi:hypothetical protein